MGVGAFLKSTGKPLEWQGSPTPGTLRANAAAAGFDQGDVEEREMSFTDFIAIAPKHVKAPVLTIESLAELLVEKKFLSAQDVEGKKK